MIIPPHGPLAWAWIAWAPGRGRWAAPYTAACVVVREFRLRRPRERVILTLVENLAVRDGQVAFFALAQGLRQRHRVPVRGAMMRPQVNDPVPVGPPPGQEGGTGGRAEGDGGVRLREDYATVCERVQVRRPRPPPSVRAQVRP